MVPPRILIVDDGEGIRSLLKRYLKQQGFEVDAVADGLQMTKQLEHSSYDLMVLDWNMPGEDGLSICRRLRKDEQSPHIIILSANGTENDRINGLEAGADDYLSKPFSPRELTARINANIRRRPKVIAAAPTIEQESLSFGPYLLDLKMRCLFKNGCEIVLTSAEFALLKILVMHAGITLSRERLGYLIDGSTYTADDRWLDVQISRLRKLLEDDPAKPTFLQTVRGVGYVFIDPISKQ
jgi:two-component system phosphate regulon response regulator OmpR